MRQIQNKEEYFNILTESEKIFQETGEHLNLNDQILLAKELKKLQEEKRNCEENSDSPIRSLEDILSSVPYKERER